MKQRTKNRICKIMAFALAMVCLLNVPAVQVKAAEATEMDGDVEVMQAVIVERPEGENNRVQARTVLSGCEIILAFSSDGLYMEMTTEANGTASRIGVKDIKVQKKVWYGWKTVAISDGLEASDRSMFDMSVTYTGAEKGSTYRVSCVHYADVDGYVEADNMTDPFVFTYEELSEE